MNVRSLIDDIRRNVRVVDVLLLLALSAAAEHSVHDGATEGHIRLVGATLPRMGTVLVHHNGQWGAICKRGWDTRDARVVCRQLGYPDTLGAIRDGRYGAGAELIWLSRVQCKGTEARLTLCKHERWGKNACRGANVSAGVKCRKHRRMRPSRPTSTVFYPSTTHRFTISSADNLIANATATQFNGNFTPSKHFGILNTTNPTSFHTMGKKKAIKTYTTQSTGNTPRSTNNTSRSTKGTPRSTNNTPGSTNKTPPSTYNATQSTNQAPQTTSNTPRRTSNTQRSGNTTRRSTQNTLEGTNYTLRSSSRNRNAKVTPYQFASVAYAENNFSATPSVSVTESELIENSAVNAGSHYVVSSPGNRNNYKNGTSTDTLYTSITDGNHKSNDRQSNLETNFTTNSPGLPSIRNTVLPETSTKHKTVVRETTTSTIEGTDDRTDAHWEEQTGGRLQEQELAMYPVQDQSIKITGVRLANGRFAGEGMVQVTLTGHEGWGAVCGDKWTVMEALVVCRQLAFGYARTASQVNYYGGENIPKHIYSVTCTGKEAHLAECAIVAGSSKTLCSHNTQVAGLICTQELPDLIPDIDLIQSSSHLSDKHLYYMECAMEENCVASSAYELRKSGAWIHDVRRLLRFSSVIHNRGTADFRPHASKQAWEWHTCHRHYHSMDVFAHYDVMDLLGNRVAEGHKSSFCLEDSSCDRGVEKKYVCVGLADQGISPNCSDNYLSGIDCQWVDVTDVPVGQYKLRIVVNPGRKVAELNYDNNAVECDIEITQWNLNTWNCTLGE